MPDLKSLTVRALRELARKHIGPGYSRLRTRSELIRALTDVLPRSVNRALEPGTSEAAPTDRPAATQPPKSEPEKKRSKGKRRDPVASRQRLTSERTENAEFTGSEMPRSGDAVTDSNEDSRKKVPPQSPAAQVEDRPPMSPGRELEAPLAPAGEMAEARPEIPSERALEEETVAAVDAEEKAEETIEEEAFEAEAAELESKLEVEAEPAPEKKEEWIEPPAAREAKYWDSQLGELPDSYGEDTVVLLVKDPFTVMVFWDFSPETRARAFEHLHGPHAKLRLYDEERGQVREVDFALEARRWYLHGLEPGRRYHVELMAVGAGGETRRIGPPSNLVSVPPKGPSPIIDDRFIRIPFDISPRRALEGIGAMEQFGSWDEARGERGAEDESERLRDRLYQLSGGHVVGASEQMPNWAAGAESRGGASAGGRYSGQWPWSGILPAQGERQG